jgi:hypothetical protein
MPNAARTTKPTPQASAPAPAPAAAPHVPTPASPALRQSGGPAVPLGGAAMPASVRAPIERSLRADMGGVRVHTGAAAERAALALSARAFAYGPNIVLGPGERANDLAVIAHEAAHVVQQRGAPAIQRLAAGQSDPLENEAHAAAAAVVHGESFDVQGHTNGAHVQRLGLGDALNYFADKANMIPGFRMFTIILGVNPINMSRVERSAANIMRAIVEFIPGGGLITQALDNYGIFDKVGAWVEQQIATLGMTGGMIKDAITKFLDSLSWSDIFDLGGVWERAKRIFTTPIDQIISFAKGLITGILTFIKDAILMPLAKLAEGTRGWDLLIAVLGVNPITGDPVERNAETLVGGFMKLIGQEEVWENVKRANAIARVWAWFQGALSAVLGFVQQIPTLAINTFKSLELVDIVVLPRAFAKVAAVFGNFIGNFISWAGNAVWNLLEIIFEVLAPPVMPYLKKAAAAFRTILKDPIGFVGNLVRAGKLGFEMFAGRFFEHLKTALIKWLTGPLGAAGVYIPKSFTLIEIVKLVLSVLGLTWQNIRSKLVKIIPDPVLAGLEKTAGILVTLVKDGPAAAWEQIKAELSQLKDQLISQVVQMVTTEVVKAAVIKLVSMLNPAGAVVQAIIAIYNTVTFFIQKINQIAQVVASFIDSISAIASGQVDNAAKKVEQTMANTLVVIIAFLAKFAGVGNIPDKLVGVVKKIRAPIDKGLDKIVAWLGKLLEKAKNALMGKKDAKETSKPGVIPDIDTPAKIGDEAHTIRVHLSGEQVVFLMASATFDNMRQKLDVLSKTYAAPFIEFGIPKVGEDIDKRIGTVRKVVERGERDMTKKLKGVTDALKRHSIFTTEAHQTSLNVIKALDTLGKQLTSGKLGKAIFGKAAKLKPGEPVIFLNPDRAMIVREVKQFKDIGGMYELFFMAESADGTFKSPLLYRDEGIKWSLADKPHFEPFKPKGVGGSVVIDKAHLNSGSTASYDPLFLGQTIAGKFYKIRGHLVAVVFGGPGGKNNIVALTAKANEAMRSSIEVPLSKKIKLEDSVYSYTAHPTHPGGNTSQPVDSVKVQAIKIYPNKKPETTDYDIPND